MNVCESSPRNRLSRREHTFGPQFKVSFRLVMYHFDENCCLCGRLTRLRTAQVYTREAVTGRRVA